MPIAAMFFAYGWPRLLASEYARFDEDWLYLCQDAQYMVAVSPSAVQLWATGLHKARLSQVLRPQDSLDSEGANALAFWCASKSTLAVVVSTGRSGLGSVGWHPGVAGDGHGGRRVRPLLWGSTTPSVE